MCVLFPSAQLAPTRILKTGFTASSAHCFAAACNVGPRRPFSFNTHPHHYPHLHSTPYPRYRDRLLVVLHSTLSHTLYFRGAHANMYHSLRVRSVKIIHASNNLKLQLGPWAADIEVVVASVVVLLPASLRLPPHFPLRPIPLPSAVKCKPTYRWKNGWFGNPNLALLFLAPGKNPNLASGFTACNLLLLSKPEGESVQIVFSILSCDVDTATRRGSLWMHIHHFESMKQAGWTNFLWRAHRCVITC